METPDFFQAGHYNNQNSDHFVIEDLLDLPNDESMDAAMTDSSTGVAADNSCNSSFTTFYDNGGTGSFVDGQFSNEFCVPDELAELEWLSNFGEESFSSEDLQKLHLIQGLKPRTTTTESSHTHQYHFQPEPTKPGPTLQPNLSVPAKARSKRSRIASGNWTSRLLAASSPSDSDTKKKIDGPETDISVEGRRCLHCATDKTPQWRTGPMGPKTLCNACGVRYKSGRLVPEYRPAASPTFVLTKHSNSHRKVVELRRQKEMMRAQQQQQEFMQHHHQQNVMFGVSNSDDQYLIHQRIGPDYRQII